MTAHANNGHAGFDDEIRLRVRELLGEIASTPDGGLQQGHLFAPETGPPPADIERHPEDPHGALHRTAEMVVDPERIRRYMVDFGITTQAIGDVEFDIVLRRILHGIYLTRGGAITAPAQVAAGEKQQISAATVSAIERILADREADAEKAKRLEVELDRMQAEVEAADAERKQAENERELAEAKVAQARRDEAKRTEGEQKQPGPVTQLPGGLFQWVRFPLYAGFLLLLIDVVIGLFMIEPPLANLVNASEAGTYLIAAGISITFGLASAAAGVALAALRLSGRTIGALFVVLFGLIMVKLVGGLDALRLGHESGVETLTVATLASCYVAALTGYAAAAYRDFAKRREEIERQNEQQASLAEAVGSDLGDAVKVRERADAKCESAEHAFQAAKATLAEGRDEAEALKDSAARANAAAHEREAEGIVADVEAETIRAEARTRLSQEDGANRWASGVAWAARAKTRAEKHPEGEWIREPLLPAPAASTSTSKSGNATLRAAAAVLGVGAVAGIVGAVAGVIVGAITMGVAAGVAGFLLILAGRLSRDTANGREAPPPAPEGPPPIGSPADERNPVYRWQPSYMVSKYRSGGPSGGERQ